VQFMLTEVRDCDLLIVVTSSTFLKRKDIKRKKAVSPDHQSPQPSIYIDKCTVYTYTVYWTVQINKMRLQEYICTPTHARI